MKKNYDTKYRELVSRINEAKANRITLFVVRRPEELGETYEEMVETLNRLAAADMNLAILPPDMRDPNE
jgi:hypothetical protein